MTLSKAHSAAACGISTSAVIFPVRLRRGPRVKSFYGAVLRHLVLEFDGLLDKTADEQPAPT
jgi:hypothetical protein